LNIPTTQRRPYPLEETAIEEEIIECNKTVLVDTISTIHNELAYLKNDIQL